jgi:carbon starvation protein
MNTLWIVILSVLTIYLAYNLYAKRIDRNVIQPDAKRATPARMYMDGVDFMPPPDAAVSWVRGHVRCGI